MANLLNFLAPFGALLSGALAQTGVETNLTTYMYPDSNITAASVYSVNGSKVAPKGADILTVGVIGDYGWAGWQPSPDDFCLKVLPYLESLGVHPPNEVRNDCDPGDKQYITNATQMQMDTSAYVGQICAMKNCSAFISVGDNFYDSGVDFTTAGILRFEEAWVTMYQQGIFDYAPWYQCLGNHDVVPGQSGVDFQTKVAPLYDDRWYFVRTDCVEQVAGRNIIALLTRPCRVPRVFHTTPTTSPGATGPRLSSSLTPTASCPRIRRLVDSHSPPRFVLARQADKAFRTHRSTTTHTRKPATPRDRNSSTSCPQPSPTPLPSGNSSSCTTLTARPQPTRPISSR